MNVFIFGCVVFFTMAAMVVLIDRFAKPQDVHESSHGVASTPIVAEQESVQSPALHTTLQEPRDVEQTGQRYVVSLNELSSEEQDLMHYGMVVGGAGVGYASCFAPQYTGMALLKED